jgi:hypothetical protein
MRSPYLFVPRGFNTQEFAFRRGSFRAGSVISVIQKFQFLNGFR